MLLRIVAAISTKSPVASWARVTVGGAHACPHHARTSPQLLKRLGEAISYRTDEGHLTSLGEAYSRGVVSLARHERGKQPWRSFSLHNPVNTFTNKAPKHRRGRRAASGRQPADAATRAADSSQGGSDNEARQLTQLITGCETWERLAAVVLRRRRDFNATHLSAAATTLARFHRGAPPERRARMRAGGIVPQLESAASAAAPALPGRALANLLHAFAVLEARLRPETLIRFHARADEVLPELNAQWVANILWAFARLGYRPPGGPDRLTGLTRRAVELLPSFSPKGVSMLLWAFATIGHGPGEGELGAFVASAHRMLPHMTPQGLANTVWALGKMHPAEVPHVVLAEGSQLALRALPSFEDQHLSNFMLGLAYLGHCPPSDFTAAVTEQAAGRIWSITPQQLANLTWAFAKLGIYPGWAYFDALYNRVSAGCQGFSPQNVSNLLWAAATLQEQPSAGFMEGLLAVGEGQIAGFAPQNLANTAWALAKLQFLPRGRFAERLLAAVDAQVHNFEPRHVSMTVWACMKLGWQPSDALLQTAQHILMAGETLNGFWLDANDYGFMKSMIEQYARRSYM